MRKVITTLVLTLAFIWSSASVAKLSVQKHKKYGRQYVIYDMVEMKIGIYNRLVRRLQTANKGEVVYIVVQNNRGGYMRTLASLVHHIERSRGTVVIETKGFIASAAALLAFQGDYVRINHDTKILFHNVRYKTRSGLVIPSRVNKNSPRKIYTYHASLNWFKRTRVATMLNREEWNQLLNGKDVIIRGKRICEWGSKTRVIANRNGSCLTRGIKS